MAIKKIYYYKNSEKYFMVIRQAGMENEFDYHDLSKNSLTTTQLDQMAVLAESYEGLFDRECEQYTSRQLDQAYLNEKDYRELILEDNAFLKQPVVVADDQIFIGDDERELNRLAYFLDSGDE